MHPILPGKSTKSLLRIIQILLTLIFFAAAALPHGNATINNISTNKVTAEKREMAVTTARAKRNKILGVYSSIVLHNGSIKYYIKVKDDSKLRGLKLCVRPHVNGGPINCVWDAKLDDGINTVSFVAEKGSTSGAMEFFLKDAGKYISLADINEFPLPGMSDADTKATFQMPHPFYGMVMGVTTNLPTSFSTPRYVVVGARHECQYVSNGCKPIEGCHNVTYVNRLPPPGRYYLCLTTRFWKNEYIPWGQNPLVVKRLVATPLSLFNGIVPVITISDADTHDEVQHNDLNMYLARCRSDTCPLSSSQKGDNVINVIACEGTFLINTVQVSNIPLNAAPGTYALCISDPRQYTSPVSFPVRVLQKPYEMRVVSVTGGLVKVNVSGGDIGDRDELYEVCVAERGASCVSVTLESNCTKSKSPNADFLILDLNSAAPGNVILCLVVGILTYNGHIYMDIQGEVDYVIEEKVSNVWILAAIAISIIILLFFVVAIVCCLRNRKAEDEGTVFSED